MENDKWKIPSVLQLGNPIHTTDRMSVLLNTNAGLFGVQPLVPEKRELKPELLTEPAFGF